MLFFVIYVDEIDKKSEASEAAGLDGAEVTYSGSLEIYKLCNHLQSAASEVKANSTTIDEAVTENNCSERSARFLKEIGNSIYIDLLDQVMNELRNDLHALYPKKYEDRDVLNKLLVRQTKNTPFDMAVPFVLNNEEWRVYSARVAIHVIDQYKSVIRPPSAVSLVPPTDARLATGDSAGDATIPAGEDVATTAAGAAKDIEMIGIFIYIFGRTWMSLYLCLA